MGQVWEQTDSCSMDVVPFLEARGTVKVGAPLPPRPSLNLSSTHCSMKEGGAMPGRRQSCPCCKKETHCAGGLLEYAHVTAGAARIGPLPPPNSEAASHPPHPTTPRPCVRYQRVDATQLGKPHESPFTCSNFTWHHILAFKICTSQRLVSCTTRPVSVHMKTNRMNVELALV